ncbi:MAG: hypothetical protein HAW62_02240 [Endozoicomonadaceae bacterium]|nr:hypothetical protein [Endozoicomonadaceae bacterium]
MQATTSMINKLDSSLMQKIKKGVQDQSPKTKSASVLTATRIVQKLNLSLTKKIKEIDFFKKTESFDSGLWVEHVYSIIEKNLQDNVEKLPYLCKHLGVSLPVDITHRESASEAALLPSEVIYPLSQEVFQEINRLKIMNEGKYDSETGKIEYYLVTMTKDAIGRGSLLFNDDLGRQEELIDLGIFEFDELLETGDSASLRDLKAYTESRLLERLRGRKQLNMLNMIEMRIILKNNLLAPGSFVCCVSRTKSDICARRMESVASLLIDKEKWAQLYDASCFNQIEGRPTVDFLSVVISVNDYLPKRTVNLYYDDKQKQINACIAINDSPILSYKKDLNKFSLHFSSELVLKKLIKQTRTVEELIATKDMVLSLDTSIYSDEIQIKIQQNIIKILMRSQKELPDILTRNTAVRSNDNLSFAGPKVRTEYEL